MKIETTYKIDKCSCGCVVTTLWADIPVKKSYYSVPYHGGNILTFMSENFSNLMYSSTNWQGINKFNELYGYNPDTRTE